MFRQLGNFALLALCLFAIAIVMGSCGRGDTEGTEGTDTSSTSDPSIENRKAGMVGHYRAIAEDVDGWGGSLLINSILGQEYTLTWTDPQGNEFSRKTGKWDVVDMTYLILDGVGYTTVFYGSSAGHSGIEISNMPTPVGRRTVQWAYPSFSFD